MEYAIIIIVLIIVGIVIYSSFLPAITKKKTIKKLYTYLVKSQKSFQLNVTKSDKIDFELTVEEKRYIAKILVVPAYSEIQINNRSTWEVKYGAGNTVGKTQPHRRYLNEIVAFQNLDAEEGTTKIVIITPKPKKIVKYINECEIVFVNSKTDVYGSTIISDTQLAIFVK